MTRRTNPESFEHIGSRDSPPEPFEMTKGENSFSLSALFEAFNKLTLRLDISASGTPILLRFGEVIVLTLNFTGVQVPCLRKFAKPRYGRSKLSFE